MSADKPKFPKLKDCEYLAKGFCGENGCYLQSLMDNSRDLGDNPEATARRDSMEKVAKTKGCKIEVARPF